MTETGTGIKKRLQKKAYEQRLPLMGAFEVSPFCNFQCRMCYVRKTGAEIAAEGGPLPVEFWLKKAAEAKEAGTMYPLLTGGEPFLYPGIRELYTGMARMGMQTGINSNASCLTEEIMEWLAADPPQRINVTLYGASNEAYGRLTGDRNGFDKVRKGLELLDKYKIRYRFNCSLTPENCVDLEAIINLGKSHGKTVRIATYMFPPVRRTGACGGSEARFTPKEAAYYRIQADRLQLDAETLQRLADRYARFQELTPGTLAGSGAEKTGQMHCNAGKCSYWIDWQGNFSACGMTTDPKISLKERKLEDAWKEIVENTDNFTYHAYCCGCVNESICSSCASMVRNETGSYSGRPDYICQMNAEIAGFYRSTDR